MHRPRLPLNALRALALVGTLSLPGVCLASRQGAGASGEPWGYLYLPRTMQLFPLTADENHIGRLTENDVVLNSPRVSRRHAVLRRTENGFELADVRSTNGTKLNGVSLRPLFPVEVHVGDRIQFADEVLLFHTSLPDLWAEELRERLLTRIVKLHLHLPQDQIHKSLGREETVVAVTQAKVSLAANKVSVENSVEVDSKSGFPEGSGAFVGNLRAKDGVLELSLWTIAAGQNMTSRRSSFANLKHVTLRVSVVEKVSDGTEEQGCKGPWFPSSVLSPLFDVFPDDPEYSLQFASSLAIQDQSVALGDAAVSLWFRHGLDPEETKLLVLAARSKALWIEREILEKGLSLSAEDRTGLGKAIEQARLWLDEAGKLGAKGAPREEAEGILVRAGERLTRLENNP